MLSGKLLSYLKKRKISRNCHSFSPWSLVVIPCHSLYQSFSLVVTRCHSLSLVVPLAVTPCTTRCHFLSLVVPLVVIVVTRCTARCHSLSLDVALACLFINDLHGRNNLCSPKTIFKKIDKKAIKLLKFHLFLYVINWVTFNYFFHWSYLKQFFIKAFYCLL